MKEEAFVVLREQVTILHKRPDAIIPVGGIS
jgi:hypothetical protein